MISLFSFDTIVSTIDNLDFSETNRIRFIEYNLDNRKDIDITKVSIKVFDEINEIIQANPQEIIKISRDFLQKNQSLTTTISFLKKLIYQYNSKINKETEVEAISVFWENSYLLKLAAYLLSERRVSIHTLNEKKKILKYFKFLGLSSREVDLIGKIRNAYNHRFSFSKDGFLTDSKGEKVADFQQIEQIFKKIKIVITWWLTTLLQVVRNNPNFSLYAFYALRDEIEQNQEYYKEYIETFKEFTKFDKKQIDVNQEEQDKDKLPLLSIWIANIYKFFKNPLEVLLYRIAKRVSEINQKKYEDGEELRKVGYCILANNLRIKIEKAAHQIVLISQELSETDDKLRMQELGTLLQERTMLPIEVGDNYLVKLFDIFRIKSNEPVDTVC